MKKISYLLIAILALISGACGGEDNNGWTIERKSSLIRVHAPFITDDGHLKCAMEYITTHFSYDEYRATSHSDSTSVALAEAITEACYR